MSYNPNIPNIADFIQISKLQLIANFQAINNSFLANHVALTAIDDVGMHNSLTLRPQVGDPVTSANQSALYNKIVSSDPQLFFRPSSNATPIQLSNSNLNTLKTGASGGTQVSFLAGPFTIYMGFILNATDLQLVTLTPSSTLRYVGLSTILIEQAPNQVSWATATNIVANQFTITYTTAQFDNLPIIYYIAIGN